MSIISSNHNKRGLRLVAIILSFFASITVATSLCALPTWADNTAPSGAAPADDSSGGGSGSSSRTVETTFFGEVTDDGKGCGVYTVLNLILDIMSIGVGILGVVGVCIVGIQYLTASGNEEQTRKSRRRFFEIIIGLVIYALLYVLLQWLTPGGSLNTGSRCSTSYISQTA